MLTLSGCSNQPHNEWDSLDYSSVYRRAAGRENDTRYTTPTIIGCLDDDLYNCN